MQGCWGVLQSRGTVVQHSEICVVRLERFPLIESNVALLKLV